MMELLPPADRNQLATKLDVADLRAEMKSDMLSMQRYLVTWLLASQAGVVAAVGVMLLALR